MTDEPRERPSLKDFDAYTDRNGQDLGQDNARDVGRPAQLQSDLKGNPMGEAETPDANLNRIRDAGARAGAAPSGAAAEAIERATAPNGKDAGE